MSSTDTPSRSKPAMFNAGLFSTPSSSASNTSGLSSLGGFGDDVFSSGSPFSLAPAKPVQSASSPEIASKTTPPRSSEKPVNSAGALFSSLPATLFPPEGGEFDGLSSVPLDTPPHTQTKPVGGIAPPTTSSAQPSVMQPGSKHGWNDPPFLSSLPSQGPQPSSSMLPSSQDPLLDGGVPSVDETSATGPDAYQVQPLLGQNIRRSESPLPPPSSVPSSVPGAPITSTHPPTGGGVANPYRLGSRRPVINTTPAYDQPLQPAAVPPSSMTATPLQTQSVGYQSSIPPPTSSQAPPISSAAPPLVSTHSGSILGSQPSIAPVHPHWFYLKANEKYWFPFNVLDSSKLDEAYLRSQADRTLKAVVQTDGGRYDVDVINRVRTSVYWEEAPSPVRRCTWFYRGEDDQWYIPYPEEITGKLEEAFSSSCVYGRWNSKLELAGGEAVIMHSPTSIVQYPSQHFQPLNYELDYSTKAVLRGFIERDKVDMGDDRSVDHVVFIVHGIGPFADIRLNSFRSLVDSVDDFREVALLMLKTHKFGGRSITNKRVEFLPVHWHAALHGDDTGVDERIQTLTLPSISRLREFTNSTLIDILFYTSPTYLQTIVNQVASEMNRILEIFCARNPGFQGGVSLMGHSLGSCILFDLLSHQGDGSFINPVNATLSTDTSCTGNGLEETTSQDNNKEAELVDDEQPPELEEVLTKHGLGTLIDTFKKEQIDMDSLLMCSNEDLKELGLPMGPRKKLNVFISEWNQRKQKQEEHKARLREEKQRVELDQQQQKLQEDAERQQGLERVKFVKGVAGTGQPLVSYPRINFNPTSLFAVGSPIGLFISVRGVETIGGDYQLPTCPGFFNIFHPYDPVAYRIEPLVVSPAPHKAVLMPHHKGRKRFHLELYDNLERVSASVKHHIVEGMRNMWNQLNELARAHTTGQSKEEEEQEIAQAELCSQVSEDIPDIQVPIGQLNGGNRIDYVLQEKPIEKINDYLFALSSHLGYWRSEDTALFILKQIYSSHTDEQIH